MPVAEVTSASGGWTLVLVGLGAFGFAGLSGLGAASDRLLETERGVDDPAYTAVRAAISTYLAIIATIVGCVCVVVGTSQAGGPVWVPILAVAALVATASVLIRRHTRRARETHWVTLAQQRSAPIERGAGDPPASG